LPDGEFESHQDAAGSRLLPRVLFVSVNPFSSTSNNGKTFASFFEGYPSESIAQLYFHRELPSSPVCDNYFRITDEDILRSRLRPWRVTGQRVSPAAPSAPPNPIPIPIPEKTHAVLKDSRTARLLRQAVWTQVRLENAQLVDWLDDFAPQVIFFCGGDAAALYPKVMALADRYDARLAFYITDDYVLPIPTRNQAARVMRWWTRKGFDRLTTQADLVLTIGEQMTRAYKAEFGFDSLPVMNMVDVPSAVPRPTALVEESLLIVYAGSMHSNRWRVLAGIAASIERLSREGLAAKLVIYGPQPSNEVRAAVHRLPFAEVKGLLSSSELAEAIAKADALVHVESDDPDSMAVTALSVSTKIPEYLASGRPILAIGPRGLASIEYLRAAAAALVVEPNDAAALDEAIASLATEPARRQELAARGLELAKKNHDASRTRGVLWRHLKSIVR